MWQVSLPIAAEVTNTLIADYVSEPEVGSVLYCSIVPGYAEHSGIYVGDGKIVHLTSSGWIEETDSKGFMSKGFKVALCIWVSCKGDNPVGSRLVADRARSKVRSHIDYNLFVNNCHQFVSGCLSGNFKNDSNILPLLKIDCEEYLDCDNWKRWVYHELLEKGSSCVGEVYDEASDIVSATKDDLGDLASNTVKKVKSVSSDLGDEIVSLSKDFQEGVDELSCQAEAKINDLSRTVDRQFRDVYREGGNYLKKMQKSWSSFFS